MSGLAVRFARDGQVADVGDVWAMLDAIPYRGPDGMAVRSVGSVALGYAKLTITPEEVDETQPLVSTRTGCAIIADVRLDNRDELFARLSDELDPSISDAELILCCYEAWGIDALPHLLGDFALVIWDPRQQRLVCARDTSGQRALFYRLDDRVFAAASEIHQLFQDPSVPVVPSEQRIVDYLVPVNFFRNEKDQHQTFYEGIWSVPAGHVLVVDPDDHHLSRYWELEVPKEIRYRSDDEYAEHFRELLFEAVRTRLRGIHPVGAMLSGGLDSSSVVCSAQELYRAGKAIDHGFQSFSMVYDGLACDERDLVRLVEEKYQFTAHYIPCPAVIDRLQPNPERFRESPNSELEEIRAIFAQAQCAGVRTLLTGDIADAIVGGSRLTFDSLIRQRKFGALRRHLRAYHDATGDSWKRTTAILCMMPLMPVTIQRRATRWYTDHDLHRLGRRILPSWMSDSFTQRVLERNREILLDEIDRQTFQSPAKQKEYSLLYPPEAAGVPAGFSLNVARPYADRRLHKFLLAIPPEQKFSPSPIHPSYYAGSKTVVRNAMEGLIPDEIRLRTSKAVFNDVFVQEIERNDRLFEEIFGPDARPVVWQRGLIKQPAYWIALQELRAGDQRRDFLYIRSLVEFETWLRGLDNTKPVHPGVPSRLVSTLDSVASQRTLQSTASVN